MLQYFKKVSIFIKSLFFVKKDESREAADTPFFSKVTYLDKTPSNDEVGAQEFLIILFKSSPMWAIFKCPCGCGDVISLAMQSPHSPRWDIVSKSGQPPSLYPSVWRSKGCYSHFFIRNGNIDWSPDSGRQPWEARPDLYSRKF